MEQHAKPLEELIKELPSQLKKDVRDFAEFLLETGRRRTGKKLRQDWAGALKDYREAYTALELQQKALEWYGEAPSPRSSRERKTGMNI